MRRYIYTLGFLVGSIAVPSLLAQPACYKCVLNPSTSYFECQTASQYEISHTSCISQFQFGCEMGGFYQPYLRSGIKVLPDGRTSTSGELATERRQFRLFDDSALQFLFLPRKKDLVVL